MRMKEPTCDSHEAESANDPRRGVPQRGPWPADTTGLPIRSGGAGHVARASFSLESAYGSVRPFLHPEDFSEVSRNAKDAKAEETALEMDET